MSEVAPFGSWRSPFTASTVSSAGHGLSEPKTNGDSIYWLERLPKEKGRQALMRWQDGTGVCELTTAEFNVGNSVHEYGGGSYAVHAGLIYFSRATDHQIYRIDGEHITKVTELDGHRFADLVIDPATSWLYAVLEQHSDDGEPTNSLVRIEPGEDPTSTSLKTIASGRDFYASPRLCGEQLAWLCWDHPQMPWDGTELWRARIDDNGEPSKPELLGGDSKTSLFQPEYSPIGALFVVSDQSGWWNLHHHTDAGLTPVFECEAEFGQPQWQFGMRTYAVVGTNDVLATSRSDKATCLWRIKAFMATQIKHNFSAIGQLDADDRHAVCIAAWQDRPPAVMRLDLNDHSWQKIHDAGAQDPGLLPYVSQAAPFSFEMRSHQTTRQVQAFYYPPTNPDFTAPHGAKPPLLVVSHGGPTAATSVDYNPKIQFWTSRGFAVADVDYTGSTGYGRAYRDLLKGYWGVFDLEDCAGAADFLVARGDADPEQLCIKGSSAGGFTTLGALTFTDTFKAGASYYGIGDLEALMRHTHKFEARYLDSLIGPYPEAQASYHERSPIRHIDKLSCPAIFLQGMKDKVVPPQQAEAMVSALEKKGIPAKILRFEDEGHGFVRGENVAMALTSELAFYGEVLGFVPAADNTDAP